ncbi:MAG: glycosyltransferase family 2 protein [Candidatus Roizmanbacteria bacterium]|nr:glycosyltransferase family 2 protein [Candidatus Roizmanbacteria bacterium]
MTNPTISVVMPTLNSEKTLEQSLISITNQTFSQDRIEILVVDGGSTDTTISIAKKYNCTILKNLRKLPEFAKHIGIRRARGQYCVFLDSDEVLTNKESLKTKYELMEQNSTIKNCLIGGLVNPSHYPFINEYASHIGDPFSYFMYGIDAGNYRQSLESKFKSKTRHDRYILYTVTNETLPICDGGGHFFDLSYLKNNFDIRNEKIVSTIFERMVGKTKHFAIVKNDFVLHYSNTSVRKYLSKIRWRVIGNIHYSKENITGFSEREKSQTLLFRIKKLLFIPLSIFLIWPIYSSVILMNKNKNILYATHILFSIYTAILILFYYALRFLNIKPRISVYGK